MPVLACGLLISGWLIEVQTAYNDQYPLVVQVMDQEDSVSQHLAIIDTAYEAHAENQQGHTVATHFRQRSYSP